MNESELLKLVQLEASRRCIRLWRNNVGATYDQTGRFLRYGLANESAGLNHALKSGDLIGITPKVIFPEDVGTIVGIFTSIEVKRPGWKYTGTKREQAQLRWAQLVVSMGGIGKMINSVEGL